MLRHYFAGYEGYDFYDDPLLRLFDFRLIAYNMMRTGQFDDLYFGEHHDKYSSIILDSGAFAAWKNGTYIDRKKYVDYCIKWKDKIDFFVNLDVIPGRYEKNRKKPRRYSEAILRNAAELGYKNYKYMVSRMEPEGISRDRIIQVYHMWEPLDILERMVEEDGSTYIGLSPSNAKGVTYNDKKEFLESCMPYVLENGKPKVKLHAFGVSSWRLMKDFPWYSVDSAAWAINASVMEVFLPLKRPQAGQSDAAIKWYRDNKWYFGRPLKLSLAYATKRKPYIRGLKSMQLRRDCIEYIRDLDLRLGGSVLRLESHDYTPQQNEEWLSEGLSEKLESKYHGGPKKDMSYIERIVQEGVQHNASFRQYINVLTIKQWAALLDPVGNYRHNIHKHVRRQKARNLEKYDFVSHPEER